MPATEGNQIQILRNGAEIFPAMLEAIRDARRSVDLLTFVYWKGDVAVDFATALGERARAGVRVRLLLDSIGARHMDPDLVKEMRQSGVHVRWFRSLEPGTGKVLTRANRRTHRKVLICDETVGFTGGVGIAEEWMEWRETHFCVIGPAVDGLHGAFIDNWIETGPLTVDAAFDRFPEHETVGSSTVQVVRGAAEAGSNDIANLLEVLISQAESRLWITTAYFNPDDELTALLIAAAQRGVDVEVLVPGEHADKRFVQIVGEARYAELLDSGITIRVYQPTMLHAKILTVDGAVATVGSANINQRSTQFDEEVNLVIFDRAVVAELDRDFQNDLAESEAIDPADWAERSRFQRAAERAASVVSDLI